jgi:eukaryotic-like serine/threonine-protein kinase
VNGQLEAGARIDRFEIVRLLGKGGMGAVYEARDPELSRSVALKLIHVPDVHNSLRLLREAQALAQLQHPNVIGVHEVGTNRDQVYIAMELVDGTSLDHLDPAPTSWRYVVALFVQAGRGLALAHEKGLVHRDIKPSNLLVDRDGRVRVGDFGLARMIETERRAPVAAGAARAAATAETVELGTPEASPPAKTPSGDGLLASPLTGHGAIVGTPRYMAPEVLDGMPATPKSDQYSFCVALDEMLPASRPRWLARAVARGQAKVAAERHATMTELVDLLEQTPVRRRRLAIAAVTVGALGACAAAVVMMASSSGTDPCSGGAQRLRGVWDAARRSKAERAVVAADPVHGAKRFAIAGAVLDRQAAGWSAMQIEACRANRVTRTQSDTLFDRRMRCLDRRFAELRSTAEALVGATDLATIDRAAMSAQQLGSLETCADAEALLAITPPPDDAAARRAVDAVQAELDAIDGLRRKGELTGLDARSAAAVEKARLTAHAPVLAVALRVRGQVLIDAELGTAASTTLRELTEVAAEAHDDATAAWAWAELLRTVGYVEGKADEATAFLPAARAAMKRAPRDPVVTARFLANEAVVLQLGGKSDDARARIAEGRRLLQEAGAATPGSPLAGALAGLAYRSAALDYMAGRYPEAERGFHEAVDASIAAFGADHPETATAWHALGESQRVQIHIDDAIRSYDEALRIRTARLGDGPPAANTLVAEAGAYQLAERLPEALAALERAEKILRSSPGSSPSDLASAIMTMASLYDAMKRPDDARRRFDEAVALYESLGGEHVNLAITLYNRGELAAGQKRCADAVDDYRRAVDLFTEQLGAEHPNLVFPLSSMGRCQVLLGSHADALVTLDRALAIPTADDAALSRFQARWYHGRALVESGRDRDAGLREVRTAIADMSKVESAGAVRAEAEAWLRK